MVENELKSILEQITALTEKVDSLEAKLTATDKEDASEEAPNPLQEKLDSGAEVLRKLLQDRFPQEKLDSWDYDKLVIASEIVPQKQVILNPMPKGTKDKEDAYSESWLEPEVEVL